MIEASPDLDIPEHYEYIGANPNITWDIVQANPDKPWDYKALSLNPNITWDIIKANPDKPWSDYHIAQNKMDKHPCFKCVEPPQLSYVLK
jgi:hypothetical protein